MQGIHLVPRKNPHPQFGPLSRARIMLEEAENIPVGVWQDIINVMSNRKGVDRFKIFCVYNPKDSNGQCAIMSEPQDGFLSLDIETSRDVDERNTWPWRVVRARRLQVRKRRERHRAFLRLADKGGLGRCNKNGRRRRQSRVLHDGPWVVPAPRHRPRGDSPAPDERYLRRVGVRLQHHPRGGRRRRT